MRPCERYNEVVFVFRRTTRLCVWNSLMRDDHSGVLIGAGWKRCSDRAERVLANDVSTRIDR